MMSVCDLGALRPMPTCGHRPAAQGDDVEQGHVERGRVEQGGLDVAAPVTGEKQVRTTVVFGQMSLRKKL